MLRQIAIDHNGEIINYRLSQQGKAFGSYCALLASIFGGLGDSIVEEYGNNLEGTLLKGYRREMKPAIEENNPTASKNEIKKLVNNSAKKKAEKHKNDLIKKIRKFKEDKKIK